MYINPIKGCTQLNCIKCFTAHIQNSRKGKKDTGSGVSSQVALGVKNPPANAGDIRDAGSVPGQEMATHSGILASRIPWTGEPGGLQSQTRLKQLSTYCL